MHLTPSAEFKLKLLEIKDYNNIIKYDDIPIKSGFSKLAYCVDWKIEKEEFKKNLLDNIEAILPEISAKYINTYKFLCKNYVLERSYEYE